MPVLITLQNLTELVSHKRASMLRTAIASYQAAGGNIDEIDSTKTLEPLLSHAARLEWPVGLRIILAAGASVNQTNHTGRTALMAAASYNRVKNVNLLLAAGADIHAINQEQSTALLQAAGAGAVKTLKILLEQGAELNKKDKRGRTALMRAAESDAKDVLQVLIAHKALLDERDVDGFTAVMHACDRKGTFDECSLTLLISAGADINSSDNYGWTPLMRAAYCLNVKACHELVSAGANVLATTKEGKTAEDILDGNDGKAKIKPLAYHQIKRLLKTLSTKQMIEKAIGAARQSSPLATIPTKSRRKIDLL